MTKKPLCVLIPTRGRPHNIPRIIAAWYATGAFGTADLQLIIDRDDMRYQAYKQLDEAYPDIKVAEISEWMPMVPKLNQTAGYAALSYEAIAFMGDDHIPRTPMWAHQIVKAHLADGAKIVYGQDGHRDKLLPTWWSMKSNVVAALDGRLVPAPVQHLFCDNAVKMLGEDAECLTYLDTVLIEHMHPAAGKGDPDPGYARVNRPAQYQVDEALFRSWVANGLQRDVAIVKAL